MGAFLIFLLYYSNSNHIIVLHMCDAIKYNVKISISIKE